MSKVIAHMSMSLDGFIAGPNPSQDNPIGTNGLKLHDWMFDHPEIRSEMMAKLKQNGATIVGYTMYHEAIPYWEGTGPLGDDVPTFVLAEANKVPENAPDVFTFVSDGIESALKQAQATAGDKDVLISGGASIVQQYLKAGLLDELHLHLVPMLLGGGTPLFGELGEFIELEKISVSDAPDVTHLVYKFNN